MVVVCDAWTGVSETVYSYDDANSKPDHLITLENKKASGGELISRFDYTYDNEGNRLSMAVEPAWETQTGTIDYDYDLIYQLTGAEGPGFETYPDASFTYDSMGNRTETVFAGQTEVYAANELNQYTTVSSTNYDYDLNGNLTDDGNQLYEYDWENRLTAVRRKSDNALIAEYRYDPFGRRAKKFVHIPESRVVSYLYDGAQVIEERNEDFEPERRFVYGPGIDEPVSIHDVASGETYFYQRDGLGSVTDLTDAEGNVVERYRYSPYGKLKIYDGSWNQLTGSTVGNPYFFTGRRYDPESGLYYYRARMYSQELGRFLQPDPIGYWGGLNLYTYCFNEPVKLIDPLGLDGNDENTGIDYETWARAYGFAGGAELIRIGTQIAIKGCPEVGPWAILGAAPFWLSGLALWWASAGGPDLVTPGVEIIDKAVESLPVIPDPTIAILDAISDDMMNYGYDPSNPVDQYDYWYDSFTGGGY